MGKWAKPDLYDLENDLKKLYAKKDLFQYFQTLTNDLWSDSSNPSFDISISTLHA